MPLVGQRPAGNCTTPPPFAAARSIACWIALKSSCVPLQTALSAMRASLAG